MILTIGFMIAVFVALYCITLMSERNKYSGAVQISALIGFVIVLGLSYMLFWQGMAASAALEYASSHSSSAESILRNAGY